MLSTDQLIDRIIECNPTASVAFLERFTHADLEAYLAHLLHAAEPRGRDSVWLRPDGGPAVVTRKPAA